MSHTIFHVPGRFTADDLTQLLERLTVERAGARTSVQAEDAQVEMLCARITLLTDALRDAEVSDAARLAARMLLADLAQVTAQFRGRANGIRASLETAVDDMRASLATDRSSSDTPS